MKPAPVWASGEGISGVVYRSKKDAELRPEYDFRALHVLDEADA